MKKENWESPVTRFERFTPNEYCAGCTTEISIIDAGESSAEGTYSWMIRDVKPSGLIEGSDTSGRTGSLVPAPTDIVYIHEMFGLSRDASSPYYYTTTTYGGLYTLVDKDNSRTINTGDVLQVIVDGTTYSCTLDGNSAASYANPKAKYYKYVKNNS